MDRRGKQLIELAMQQEGIRARVEPNLTGEQEEKYVSIEIPDDTAPALVLNGLRRVSLLCEEGQRGPDTMSQPYLKPLSISKGSLTFEDLHFFEEES